ncbi:tyrosine-protein kinase RYK-like [Neocloeon triangulifer]|uniref:tyrosine-protein kinase RYK-like n=1 Tax=Neocloeon triangulifer TaxID=2078957 RepID=UPI00286F1E37|nr:tyrosine-protein kinase RYK-like [Neocloeon triangulifer]
MAGTWVAWILSMWLCLVTAVRPAYSHFNLFISQQEVKKLMGLNAELYYVRDGVINSYALNFVVPIPANITALEFSWQSLARQPLSYALRIEYNNFDALKPPHIDIPAKGIVPSSVQPFHIQFQCTGLRSAEIEVLFQLNVTSANPRHNVTLLNFRRKKICLKAEMQAAMRNDSVHLATGSLNGGTFYVAVGSACAMIALIVASASLLYVRSKKSRAQESLHTSYTTAAAYGSNPNVFIRLDSANNRTGPGSVASGGSYATIASFQKIPLSAPVPYYSTPVLGAKQPTPIHAVYAAPSSPASSAHIYCRPHCGSRTSYYASSQISMSSKADSFRDPRASDPADRLRLLAVPGCRVNTKAMLQEGTFGRVYKGTYRSEERPGVKEDEVMIKTVTDVASPFQVALLLAEGSMFYGLQHQNLLPILAVGLPKPRGHPMLVYPLMGHGNLKRFLQNCRLRGSNGDLPSKEETPLSTDDEEGQSSLTTQDLVHMALQVVLALMYLHGHKLSHRDVATRNCVVDERLRVKVTDSALARDLFPDDYHCLGDNENRPIRWMAVESLLHRKFSSASDVWAFGVLLWELATLAQQPYAEIDPYEMAEYLRDGYRLVQPVNCPDELFSVMACCWLSSPEERPTFPQLLPCLQAFYTALGRYV